MVRSGRRPCPRGRRPSSRAVGERRGGLDLAAVDPTCHLVVDSEREGTDVSVGVRVGCRVGTPEGVQGLVIDGRALAVVVGNTTTKRRGRDAENLTNLDLERVGDVVGAGGRR